MSKVVKITDANFEGEVLASVEPVLLDFSAAWCGPCKQLEPIVEEIAGEYAGRLKVGAVDIEEAPQTAVRYGVLSVPTVILVQKGEIRERVSGLRPKAELAGMISRVI